RARPRPRRGPRRRGPARSRTLVTLAAPAHAHTRAVLRRGTIGEGERRAAALEQRLGNEDAEPEAADLALAARRMAAARQIRLPDAIENLGGKTRPVVRDRDRDLAVAPVRRDLDPGAREIDGILHEIAEPVDDRRVVIPDRLGGAILRQRHVDRDAEIAMWGHHFLDQGRKLGAVER